jgi:hypothetical protein
MTLSSYTISDVSLLSNEISYSRAFINYYNGEKIIIENNKFELIIDKYVIIYGATKYLTDKKNNYLININNIPHSIWDWGDNQMLPSIQIASAVTTQRLDMKGSLTLTNVEIPCAENSYVLIEGAYYKINNGQVKYGDNIYNIDVPNNWVIINNKMIDVEISEVDNGGIKQYKGTVEIDPTASLTLDVQYRQLNEKIGGVRGFTLSNESEIEQNIKVLIKQEGNDKIGTFNITLL